MEKFNSCGGAIAMGHPIAATGARISAHVVHKLRRNHEKIGIASACIAGGQVMDEPGWEMGGKRKYQDSKVSMYGTRIWKLNNFFQIGFFLWLPCFKKNTKMFIFLLKVQNAASPQIVLGGPGQI